MQFSNWKIYFENNQSHFDHIEWNTAPQLSEDEKKLITNSLQQFQKGEQSEGKHLYSYAKTFPDPAYVEAIRLFIKEEQDHARVLARFMEIENIPRIRKHWLDNIFRVLRKLSNLENTVTVLITAEIIAKPYYKALKNATNSRLLVDLCNQILTDEEGHIAFQVDTLKAFYLKKNMLSRFMSRVWHRILMMATILIVWKQYHRLFNATGSTLSIFFMETMLIFLAADREIRGISNSQTLKIRELSA